MNEQVNVSKVMASLVEVDAIPNIRFKPQFMLSGLVDNVQTTTPQEENDMEIVQKWVSELYTAAGEESMIEQQISEIVITLVEQLKGAFTHLQGAQQIVEEITTAIDNIINHAVAIDPKLTGILAKDVDPISYQELDIEGLTTLGRTIPEMIVTTMGLQDLAPAVAYARIMETYLSSKTVALGDMDIQNQEDIDGILGVVNATDDSWTIDDVKMVYNLLTKSSAVVDFKKMTHDMLTNEMDRMGAIVNALQQIRVIGNLVSPLSEEISNRGYETTTIAGNYTTVVNVLELCQYFVDYHLRYTFANTVLFPNKLINPLMKDKFKATGMTYLDVERHIAILNSVLGLPREGITLENLETNATMVAEAFAKKHTDDTVYATSALARIKRNAIIHATSKYFQGTSSTGDLDYIAIKAEQILTKDIPIEDLVYELVIHIRYNDEPLTKIMYKNLGLAIMTVVRENPEADSVTIAKSVGKEYLDVVTEVIAKTILQ